MRWRRDIWGCKPLFPSLEVLSDFRITPKSHGNFLSKSQALLAAKFEIKFPDLFCAACVDRHEKWEKPFLYDHSFGSCYFCEFYFNQIHCLSSPPQVPALKEIYQKVRDIHKKETTMIFCPHEEILDSLCLDSSNDPCLCLHIYISLTALPHPNTSRRPFTFHLCRKLPYVQWYIYSAIKQLNCS